MYPPIQPRPSAAERDRVARDTWDVLVVGGGINGCGIARDLAGRGLKVLLVEREDLAQHTSSASTKLIHGGLRYLEYHEYSLVRKALAERERLLRAAPHIMWPLRFVMPHDAGMRPAWMIRIGLFLYDHLARREWLPGSQGLDLRRHPAGAPLKPGFSRGFVYSDGWVDDARLVVLNAIDAAERGATVLTRCACLGARREGGLWQAELAVQGDAATTPVRARALVNAAGPWTAQFSREGMGLDNGRRLRLVKGSHIVVRRLFEHDHAYLFQNPDGRIIFAIPYEGAYTLIGTTDVEIAGAPGSAAIDAHEVDYLCTQASRYFARAVKPDDVVWTYSGVRPLLDDASGNASAVTRDYLLDFDGGAAGAADTAGAAAPALSVWGGKITTFRTLAEEAADGLCRRLGVRAGAWTSGVPLPGGDLSAWTGPPQRPDTDFARFADEAVRRHPQVAEATVRRWARAYGSRLAQMLPDGADPGAEVLPGLHEAELAWLQQHEGALTAEDVLWRRSKLGLHCSADDRERLHKRLG